MKQSFKYLLFLLFVSLWACSPNTSDDPLPLKVAKAYGFENFSKVDKISYAWNVQPNPETVRTRHWEWLVKEQLVKFTDADTSYTYSLETAKEDMPPADGGFINDKYWLMFPFQLAWDTGYSYEVTEETPAPISGEKSTLLTIVYNQEDGYTPGDAYDLYLDANHKIREWVFRKSNNQEGRAFTWEDEKTFNGLTFATTHKNADGNLFIWFSDIIVE
jgi:hypothetical protein